MGINEAAEKLSKTLKPNVEGLDSHAAVVVLLKSDSQDFQVLLVKRAERATDPWSGQTALPGGKRDPEDRNMEETVVRETLEETGINLFCCCRFLGVMCPQRSVQRPEMRILPFVVLLEGEQDIVLNEELTEYFWVPLRRLVHSRDVVRFSFGEYPAYRVDGKVIWGLTYRILDKLINML